MQWTPPILVLGCCISAALDEFRNPILLPNAAEVDSSLSPGCRVGAAPDEEPGRFHCSPFRRPMQRCRPNLILGCCVGAVLDEEPGESYMTHAEESTRSCPGPSHRHPESWILCRTSRECTPCECLMAKILATMFNGVP